MLELRRREVSVAVGLEAMVTNGCEFDYIGREGGASIREYECIL